MKITAQFYAELGDGPQTILMLDGTPFTLDDGGNATQVDAPKTIEALLKEGTLKLGAKLIHAEAKTTGTGKKVKEITVRQVDDKSGQTTGHLEVIKGIKSWQELTKAMPGECAASLPQEALLQYMERWMPGTIITLWFNNTGLADCQVDQAPASSEKKAED